MCPSVQALTAASAVAYGRPYVDEALFYHLGRRDPRHNFSAHFLPAYLTYESPPAGLAAALLALPQWAATLGLAAAPGLAADLPAALFAQTLAFVALNRVYTAQYFSWYCVLLPLVLPSRRGNGGVGLRGPG